MSSFSLNKLHTGMAPIGLSVYSGPEHLQETINALRFDPMALASEQTVLFGRVLPGENDAVLRVGEFILRGKAT